MSKPIEIICQQCLGLLRITEVPKHDKGNCPDCGFEIQLRQYVPELFDGLPPLVGAISPRKGALDLSVEPGDPENSLKQEKKNKSDGSYSESGSLREENHEDTLVIDGKADAWQPFSSHFVKTTDDDSADFKSLFENELISSKPELSHETEGAGNIPHRVTGKSSSIQEQELKEKQEALTRKETDLEELEAQIGRKQKGIDAARAEIEAKTKEFEAKEKDLELASVEKGKLEEEHNKLKLAREELEKNRIEQESQRTNLENKSKEAEKFNEELKQLKKSLEAEKESWAEEVKSQSNISEELGISKESLGNQEQELKEKQEALTRKETDLEELEAQIGRKQKGIDAARAEIESKAKELDAKESDLELVSVEKGKLEEEHNKLKLAREELEKDRLEQESQRATLERKSKEAEKFNEELKQLKKSLEAEKESWAEEVKSQSNISEELEISKESLGNQEQELKEKREALTRKETDLEGLESHIRAKQKGIDAARAEIEAKTKELEAKGITLENKEERLRDYQKEIEFKKKGLEESRTELENRLESFAHNVNTVKVERELKGSSRLAGLISNDDEVAKEQRKLEALRSKVREDYNALEAEKKDFAEYKARMKQSLNEQAVLVKSKSDYPPSSSKKIAEIDNEDSYLTGNIEGVDAKPSKRNASKRFAPSKSKQKKSTLRRFDEVNSKNEEANIDKLKLPTKVSAAEKVEKEFNANSLQKEGNTIELDSMKIDNLSNSPRNKTKGKLKFWGLIIIPFIICSAFGYLVFENLMNGDSTKSLVSVSENIDEENQVLGELAGSNNLNDIITKEDSESVVPSSVKKVILPELSNIDLDLEPADVISSKQGKALIAPASKQLKSKAQLSVLLYDDVDIKGAEHVGLLVSVE